MNAAFVFFEQIFPKNTGCYNMNETRNNQITFRTLSLFKVFTQITESKAFIYNVASPYLFSS